MPTIQAGRDDLGPKLSQSLEVYFRHKGQDKSKVFFNVSRRACGYLIDVAGDKELGRYTRADALAFRDGLRKKGLVGSSVGRLLNCLTAVFNFNVHELDLKFQNPFSGVFLDKKPGTKKRQAITIPQIHQIQAACKQEDDDILWLVSLISDTGMRLAEAAGLLRDDIDLSGNIPVVHVQPHPWRTLKTDRSKRTIPLVGQSLWAAERIVAMTKPGDFALGVNFDQYFMPRHNNNEAVWRVRRAPKFIDLSSQFYGRSRTLLKLS